MSASSINQLFQITSPTRSDPNSVRAESPNSDLFSSHLERAADAAEVKPVPKDEQEESSPLAEDDNSLQADVSDRETATNENEQTTSNVDSTAPGDESEDESQSEEQLADEVELSATADQAADEESQFVVNAEQSTIDPTIVSTATIDKQQQEGQAAGDVVSETKAAEATTPFVVTTTTATAPQGETLLSEEEAATEELTENPEQEVGNSKSMSQAASQEVQAAEQSKANDFSKAISEQKQAEAASSQAAVHSQQSTKKSVVEQYTEQLPASSAGEESEQRSDGNQQQSQALRQNVEVSTVVETELAAVKSSTAAEPIATAPTATTVTANNDVAVAAGRTGVNATTNGTENAQKANAEQPANEGPTVDRVRFVRRVSGAIRTAQQRDGQIQLRLSPPELGTLRISLAVSEGAVTAHLETETAAARNVLLDNLPALRERLAEQEIRIEKFDVDVGRDQQQQQTESRQDEQRRDAKPRTQSSQSTESNREKVDNVTSPLSATPDEIPSGLDVRI